MISACVTDSRETIELRDISAPDITKVQAFILDDKLEKASAYLQLLSPTQVQKAYLGLIRSYEFAPEVHDALKARELLEGYQDHNLACMDDYGAEYLPLTWAIPIALSRQLICNSALRELPMAEINTPSHSFGYWLLFPHEMLKTYHDMTTGKAEPLAFMVREDNRSRIQNLTAKLRPLLEVMTNANIVYRHSYDAWPPGSDGYNQHVKGNPIGQCFYERVPHDRKIVRSLEDVFGKGSLMAAFPAWDYLIPFNGLAARGHLSKESLSEFQRIVGQQDFASFGRLAVQAQDEIVKQLPDEKTLLIMYCWMAFSFATIEELDGSSAMERCIAFHSSR